jgi:hypothetical protein
MRTLDKIIDIVRSIIKLPRKKKRGKPYYVCSVKNASVFSCMVLKVIYHFKTAHKSLVNNLDSAEVLGLKRVYRVSRRFKRVYEFVKEQI